MAVGRSRKRRCNRLGRPCGTRWGPGLEHLEVPAGHCVPGQLGLTRLVQRKLGGRHHDVGIGELAQLAELFGGESGVRRTASAV